MTDLANLLTLAAAAQENADECPDCADNYWELHDALDPTTVTDLVTRLQAAEAALPKDPWAWDGYMCYSCQAEMGPALTATAAHRPGCKWLAALAGGRP